MTTELLQQIKYCNFWWEGDFSYHCDSIAQAILNIKQKWWFRQDIMESVDTYTLERLPNADQFSENPDISTIIGTTLIDWKTIYYMNGWTYDPSSENLNTSDKFQLPDYLSSFKIDNFIDDVTSWEAILSTKWLHSDQWRNIINLALSKKENIEERGQASYLIDGAQYCKFIFDDPGGRRWRWWLNWKKMKHTPVAQAISNESCDAYIHIQKRYIEELRTWIQKAEERIKVREMYFKNVCPYDIFNPRESIWELSKLQEAIDEYRISLEKLETLTIWDCMLQIEQSQNCFNITTSWTILLQEWCTQPDIEKIRIIWPNWGTIGNINSSNIQIPLDLSSYFTQTWIYYVEITTSMGIESLKFVK